MLNRTGLPNPNDINLGRGAIYFAEHDANSKPLDWRHLGNSTNFGISFDTETIEHSSSRGGVKTIDLELLSSQKTTLAMTLDEINFQNLALFFSGEAADVTSAVPTSNAAKLGMTDVLQVSKASKGRWVDLVDASGRRLYDIVQANLTVKTESGGGGTPGTTLAFNVDYTLDLKMGRIFLLTTGVTHVNGKQVYGSYTADATAKDIDQVRVLTKAQIIGSVKFIGKNPASSPSDKQTEYQFHLVTLRPEGELLLIGDEFTELSLAGTAGANTKFSPLSPVCTITDHADS